VSQAVVSINRPGRSKSARQKALREQRASQEPLRFDDLADIVTVSQAARYFGVSTDSIYTDIALGKLAPVIRFGSALRIPKSTIAARSQG